jgi:hypothetical protein
MVKILPIQWSKTRTFNGMLDANPLRDSAMHPPVDIPHDAHDGPARHTNPRLKHRRRVHDDDLAFRFWIDGKLFRTNQPTNRATQ